jgi:hypothetical protein
VVTSAIVRLDDKAWARLMALASEYELTISETLERVLDREPHDHPHRCPTCARLAGSHRPRQPDQAALFG